MATITSPPPASFRLRRMFVDTLQEPVVYMRSDCPVCRSEGFGAQARIRLRSGEHEVTATLNVVLDDALDHGEAGLSEAAWRLLQAAPGDVAEVGHPDPLPSLAHVRRKIFGGRLDDGALRAIIDDLGAGRYSDIEIAAFVTACAGDRLDLAEIVGLTRAMIATGSTLRWNSRRVLDKHCVGGLPGNRTSLLVVPIVAAAGRLIPKTSSRAITSPAGTADAMETIAPVDLSREQVVRVVESEGGCIAWGGRLGLSPADDVLISVERPLDIDAVGQLVASVLSKKAAAGATDVLIDVPVGPTAKIRSEATFTLLSQILVDVGAAIGLRVRPLRSDGRQPVGRGIGPSLEARDALAVLRNDAAAPPDLRERALDLAGAVLELDPAIPGGTGRSLAQRHLDDGSALAKLEAICEKQGGRREPGVAPLQHPVEDTSGGRVIAIDNRRLARAAKLAGAPRAPTAGAELHVRIGRDVAPGEPLFTLHAETPGQLRQALAYVAVSVDAVTVERES